MAQVQASNNFNNLLFNTKRFELAQEAVRKKGHTPLDLRPKVQARIIEVLTAGVSQLNGKSGDFIYAVKPIHSRPYLNYVAGFDPTILNAIRNKYVDVSGLVIKNKNLPEKSSIMAYNPQHLKTIGIVL